MRHNRKFACELWYALRASTLQRDSQHTPITPTQVRAFLETLANPHNVHVAAKFSQMDIMTTNIPHPPIPARLTCLTASSAFSTTLHPGCYPEVVTWQDQRESISLLCRHDRTSTRAYWYMWVTWSKLIFRLSRRVRTSHERRLRGISSHSSNSWCLRKTLWMIWTSIGFSKRVMHCTLCLCAGSVSTFLYLFMPIDACREHK